ncbi:MAG: DUF2309 domain-containing protein [Isosphaeraceae bacterium]|jgi:uncharacterized protein YbcC (UPF0753/DUF2309 family)
MHTSTVRDDALLESATHDADLHTLSEVIEHAGHLLPAQGPITVFIHHNTLHGFEDLPFNEAVQKAAYVFGCQPYLSEDRYRQELMRGRIRFAELKEALEHDLGDRAGEKVPCFGTRLDLRLAMLQNPLRTGPTEELVWYVAEANALRRIRRDVSAADRARLIAETRRWVIRDLRGFDETSRNGSSNPAGDRTIPDSLAELLFRFGKSKMEYWSDEDWESLTLQALWRVCCDGVRDIPSFTTPPPLAVRHRDVLLEATGVDTDLLVDDRLIPLSAAFLDQGFAHWQLPRRDEGFYRAFCSLYRLPWGPPDRWMRGLAEEVGRLLDEGIGPLESALESLRILGVAKEEWERYVSATLLALRGWAGMVRQIEARGDRVVRPVPQGSLVEFLAIRLLLDRFAVAYTARSSLGIKTPVREFWRLARGWVDPQWPLSVEQRAFPVFQLAQISGLSPDVLYRLDKQEWRTILQEIDSFSGLERRRVFHLAYERRFYTQTADAVALHVRHPAPTPSQPRFQAIFCIDEREESLRRHVEELAPDATTFGTAGFFSVAMYYRGVADAHFVPLCPGVIRPGHWVAEQVIDSHEQAHQLRQKTRRALGMASFRFNVGSRSLAPGALLTAVVGVLASIPLVARTLLPRFTSRISRKLGRFVESPPLTRLQLERTEEPPGEEGGRLGFTLDEMTDIGEKVLREIGLTAGFSRLVFVIGHGSSSLNNPHESAYDCGACGGARGGPNGRALAQMLNDGRVRERLAGRGLVVPAETYFVGGMHNTSSDTLAFFDLDLLPESHLAEFSQVREIFTAACERNAHERSRRFESASLSLSYGAAHQHVEARSEDLAQVRPELGHATNALCIVGRREKTRGLFLDRRAFLCSYDPTQDDTNGTILTQNLKAVFPVCAGINLEYYFSYVDNVGWGSGSKLPHNVVALLGVMEGALSDLRTGLPWQMVEIHEPVRIMFIIETTVEAMLQIMDRNEGIGKLCRNRWVRLAVLDPATGELSLFQLGGFRPYQPQAGVLPKAASSVDWYRGWRDHLEFAEIEGQL